MKPNLSSSFEEQKRESARQAVSYLLPNQRLSLGSGSTSECFIRELAKWPLANSLQLVATSRSSEQLANNLGLKVLPLDSFEWLDISIDGADFVDNQGRLIKGFGGALTREKIAASLAKELWILVDKSKYCQELPLSRLPLEILPLARPLVESALRQMNISCQIRLAGSQTFLSDNGGWILDIDASSWKGPLEELADKLKGICGAVEHGLFLHFKPRLFG